jgi:hypothetical protein
MLLVENDKNKKDLRLLGEEEYNIKSYAARRR